MNHRRLLVVVLFLVIFSFDIARTTDIDFWWHLKTGELMAQAHAVPTSDPFLYTAAGESWVVHEWLWELAAFAVYGGGGYVAVVLLSAMLVTATYAVLSAAALVVTPLLGVALCERFRCVPELPPPRCLASSSQPSETLGKSIIGVWRKLC